MIQKRIISVFKSNPVSLAIVPIIVIVLSFGLNYAYATWSEPSGTPPNNNTDTPLNVGVAEQMKTGNLGINTVLPVGHAHSVQAVFSVGNQNNPFNVDNAGDIVVTGGTDGIFAFYHMPPGSTAPSEKISFEPDGSMTLMKDGGSVVAAGNLGINTVLPVGHAHSVQAVFSVGNQNNPFNVDNAGDIVVTGGTDGRFAFYHMPPGSTAPSEKISFEPDGSMALMKDGGSVVVGHSWDNTYSSYINTGDVWLRDANNGRGAWASTLGSHGASNCHWTKTAQNYERIYCGFDEYVQGGWMDEGGGGHADYCCKF